MGLGLAAGRRGPHVAAAVLFVLGAAAGVYGALAAAPAALAGSTLCLALAALLLLVRLLALEQRLRRARRRRRRVHGRLWRRIDQVGGEVDAARAQFSQLAELRDDLGAMRGSSYLSLPRRLSTAAARQMCGEWSERLGWSVDRAYLRYLERKLLHIEATSHGRLAGSVEDGLLRALVARSAPGPAFAGLEIGVLFGLSSLLIHEAVSPFFEEVRLVLVDPLEGYYTAGRVDPLTHLPVSERLLRGNLARWGVPAEQVTLVKGFSSDPAVRGAVSRHRYSFLLIDGDHSFEGVAADFEHYAPLLRSGGYLVMDDYRAPSWPGVTRFVDEVLAAAPHFQAVGVQGNTAVFRKAAGA
jgi:predicted O-methyltransferase YrrM